MRREEGGGRTEEGRWGRRDEGEGMREVGGEKREGREGDEE